jgi:hypothetical protein
MHSTFSRTLAAILVAGALLACGSSAEDDNQGETGVTGKALGVDCTKNEECESQICFLGGKASWCSLKCTAENATQICPVPPFDGTCNKQGFCRRPN